MTTTNMHIMPQVYQLAKPSDGDLCADPIPFNEGFLPVSSVHRVWFGQYGNPAGAPVLTVHGGPGGGSHVRDPLLFEKNFYRVILFDQRGAGKSEPHGETQENTTGHLIDDMEKLRRHLSINQWLLFGGSWGSALSLAYGQQHPDQVLGFILRGIFLGTKAEYHQLWTGMGDIYPEQFDLFLRFLPEPERNDPMMSYYKRLIDPDAEVHLPAARAFCQYDFHCATIFDKSRLPAQLADNKRVLALARLFAHYSVNQFYLAPDQLIKGIAPIAHLPALMVHGRYDIICRVSSAYRLLKHWPSAELFIVPDGGHSSFDPGVKKALLHAAARMKDLLLQRAAFRASTAHL